MVHRVLNWLILILTVLCVPFTHGILEYCGLLLIALLMVILNSVIAKRRKKVGGLGL